MRVQLATAHGITQPLYVCQGGVPWTFRSKSLKLFGEIIIVNLHWASAESWIGVPAKLFHLFPELLWHRWGNNGKAAATWTRV